jgi:hypothetical protein
MHPEQRETYEREAERLHQERRADALERKAAGMGFWRLALVVAVGILIAQVVSAGVLWIVALIGPPAQ